MYHSRRHSLDVEHQDFGDGRQQSLPSASAIPRHSTIYEQRRPTMAHHGQSLSWSGPGDSYDRQQGRTPSSAPSAPFNSSFTPSQQHLHYQQQQHPLAGLMMGGDVAARAPLDYSREEWVASPAEVQHSRTRGMWGDAGDTQGGESEWYDERVIKEEEEEDVEQQGWESCWDDRREERGWSIEGPEPEDGVGKDEVGYQEEEGSYLQHQQNPYPSPHEPTTDLPALPMLGDPSHYHSSHTTTYGTHTSSPIASTSTQQLSASFTPHYNHSSTSQHALSFSAPEARTYPSFASMATEMSPVAAQFSYIGDRSHAQRVDSSRRGGAPTPWGFPSTAPRYRASTVAVEEASTSGQGSLLGPIPDVHYQQQQPTSMQYRGGDASTPITSPISPGGYSSYNHAMSMSPLSYASNGAQSPMSPLQLPPLPSSPEFSPSAEFVGDDLGGDTECFPPRPPPAPATAEQSDTSRPKPPAKRKRGTIPREIDPESGRPISPITGKVTKQISPRGKIPKDILKRIYTCPFDGCERIFGRPSARETHIRSHSGAQPFTCPISTCQRPFSVFSNLKRHMIVHPTVDFREVCVTDLPHIRCRDSSQGPVLEWDDDEEAQGEDVEGMDV